MSSLSVKNNVEEPKYNSPVPRFDGREYAGYDLKHVFPWRYLDAIGIEKYCEMIMEGKSPKQLAKEVGVSQRVIKAWIEANAERLSIYNAALEYEADNMQFDARDILDNAPLISEAINKAGKQAEQRRVMAAGFGKARWGKQASLDIKSTATVSYNFNVALDDKQKAQIIEGESKRIERDVGVELDINELLGAGLTDIDLSLGVKDELTYEEAAAQEESDEDESA